IMQTITPVLMFTGANSGKAEEAMNFYASVFPQSSVNVQMRYGKGQEPDTEGTVTFANFTLDGEQFAAMDSAHPHGFGFNEAISFLVHCESQQEIDRYWERLSADPKSEQCGWLKDKYGVSWQIVPTAMDEMMSSGDAQQIARVTQAFLKMKKFDIAALWAAYEGK
ncbi:MAG TPA: VOC family protein, partial [Thermoanaerobaculia bacterium]